MRLRLPRLYSRMLKENRRWQRQVKSLVNVVTAKSKTAKSKPASGKVATPAIARVVRRVKPRALPVRLKETLKFGPNSGDLRMLSYAPPGLEKGSALVVVLHGCQQTAEDFDRASGWGELARRHGFAVLYPEQKPANNHHLCFNWFRPSSVRRDRGEVGSVRVMIDVMLRRHKLSPERIYVFGLSAGGALAGALLAAYPDVFAAGCVVAGMPVGAARDAVTAMRVMGQGTQKSTADWASLAREASGSSPNAWPAISVWHGTHDRVVATANADATVGQWLALHGIEKATAGVRQSRQCTVSQWRDAAGRIAVEEYRIDGMAHGLPVTKTRLARARDKRFYLDAGICAATTMARRWNLAGKG